eukprot:TRINITY_DN37593_c0_g1_i1.p1 TRINITY_DN37593_c0_g1~~TRINITY_DN37593_c0_g1_i1.p1  ORF type:complete len:351 (-),score=47.03 TRINITY_DN37593_c0_g1_i1:64-1044(-)
MASRADPQQPLLNSEPATASRCGRPKLLLAALGSLSVCLVLVATSLPQPGQELSVVMVPRAGSAGNAGADEASAKPVGLWGQHFHSLDKKCWSFTGGTCNVYGCNAERNATCVRPGLVFAYCDCPDGCAGPDGACHNEDNKLVTGEFTLTNVKWSDQHLYVPSFVLYNQLRTSAKGEDTEQYKFQLYRVPGKSPDGLQRYMLASESNPDYVVSMQDNWNAFVPSIPGQSVYKTNVIKGAGRGSDGMPHVILPQAVMWVVCRPKRGTGLQIGVALPTYGSDVQVYVWMYMHTGSWMTFGWVQTWWGEPDARARWTAEPPIDVVDECP